MCNELYLKIEVKLGESCESCIKIFTTLTIFNLVKKSQESQNESWNCFDFEKKTKILMESSRNIFYSFRK